MRRDLTRLKTAIEAELKGPVKQLMQVWYKASLIKGVVVQGKIEIGNGAERKNYVITYDKSGNKIKEKEFGDVIGHTHYYNDKGQQIATDTYYKNNLYTKGIQTYNDEGKPLENVVHTADGNIQYRVVDTYNDRGQQLEHIHYSGKDAVVIARTINTYSESGKMLSHKRYGNKGTLESETIHTYNEKDQEIESKTSYTDEASSKYNMHFTKKYNEYGDCIEMTYYNNDGSLKNVSAFTYEYDSEGKRILLPSQHFDPYAKEPGETEEVENDSYGNWIKKTEFANKIPANIIIREISYYSEDGVGDDSPGFIHPLLTAKEDEKQKEESNLLDEIEPAELNWIAEAINTSPDNFSLYRYYVARFKEIPSLLIYTGPYIEALVLRKELKDNMNAEEIHSYHTQWGGNGKELVRYTLNFRMHPGYLLHAMHISRHDEDEFVIYEYVSDKLRYRDGVHFSQFQLLRPSDASGKRNSDFEDELDNCINRYNLAKKPEKPVINMIEVADKGFTMQEHPVDDDFQIKDLDINYGYGFEKFHNDLMHRFNTSTKGLVLFHGEPGTGKTYYIRHLLRSMVSNKKVVIYMPPNMVDHLVEPAFMTFLVAEVKSWSEEGFFCVLLIEDAEPLLAKRQQGVRIQGITNLLNMSDGLLNDMLNLQIICTFNVDLKKLDSALLRPGRLIARKEFKALGELDANLLAQRLGIKHHFKGPATLGEIYAMLKNKNTLVHDVEPDRDSSTIIDDLL